MQPLASVLNRIHTIDENLITCHMATFCWLYASVHDHLPDVNQYVGTVIGPQAKMAEMVRIYGREIHQPIIGTLRLTPGSVIVFVHHTNGDAMHSCVAFSASQICGYNQVEWFSTPGTINRKTIHSTSDLKWKTGLQRNLVRAGAHDAYTCKLYSVSETSAKHYFMTLP